MNLLPLGHGRLATPVKLENLLEVQIFEPHSGLWIQEFRGWHPSSLPGEKHWGGSRERVLELGIQGLITVGGG